MNGTSNRFNISCIDALLKTDIAFLITSFRLPEPNGIVEVWLE